MLHGVAMFLRIAKFVVWVATLAVLACVGAPLLLAAIIIGAATGGIFDRSGEGFVGKEDS